MARMAKKVPTEDQEQAALATWLRMKGIRFYAIPNGGYRNPLEGLKFKRTGVSSGVPDICIPQARGSYHGLYIELKRMLCSKVSDSQKEWINYLTEQNYYACVAKGFEEARDVVLYYLSLEVP